MSGSGTDEQTIARSIGPHTMTFEPPAVIGCFTHGEITPEHVTRFAEFIHEHAGHLPSIVALTDLGKMGVVSQEARRTVKRVAERIPLRGIAYYGGSFQTKLLAKLMLGLLNLLTPRPDVPVRFFATEAEARAWLAARVRALEEEQQRRSRP